MSAAFWRGFHEGVAFFPVSAWVVVWVLWVAGACGLIDFHVCIGPAGACK